MTPSLKQPAAFLPILMSLGGLALLVGSVVRFGLPHDTVPHDEGTAAHIFQILMIAQLPIAAFFALKWLPQAPKETLRIIGLQIVAWLVAVGAVLFAGA